MAQEFQKQRNMATKSTKKIIATYTPKSEVYRIPEDWDVKDISISFGILFYKGKGIDKSPIATYGESSGPIEIKQHTDDESDSEDEYEYTAYGYDEEYGIKVAGGGLSNGNTCAYVKEKNNEYWYYEYGKYPRGWKIGNEIDWDEEHCSFNILP